MTGRALFLTLLCAALAAPSPVGAQCRLCSAPSTNREEASGNQDIRLEVETNMSFDRLILAGQGSGSADLRPDGSSSSSGAVTDVSPRAVVGTVTLHGEANRAIRLDLPRRIVLHSLSGGEVTFEDVTSDLPSMPRLDAAGNLTVRFGGRLRVSGDAEGDYRGDLPITAEYL